MAESAGFEPATSRFLNERPTSGLHPERQPRPTPQWIVRAFQPWTMAYARFGYQMQSERAR